jgi:nicotinamidase/pyrazinamidase
MEKNRYNIGDAAISESGGLMGKEFMHSALILVDIQNDFCPGGALAVQEGDKVVEVVNTLMPVFPFVLATQDWHPSNHISFKEQGGIWPPHCVQNSYGAELHPALNQEAIDLYFHKAFKANNDSYSGFDGVDANGRSLNDVLKAEKIKTVYMTGLATDYCVKETALDALKNGFEVFLVTDAIRAVNVNEGDGEKALQEVKKSGARLISSNELIKMSKTARAFGD